ELLYSWSNNGIVMQQRQTFTLVQSARPEELEALMIAATCSGSFTEHWDATYDRMLASMKLRRPWLPEDAVPAPASALNADPQPTPVVPRYGFALSRDGTLHVMPTVSDLQTLAGSDLSALRTWKFYRHDGQPLAPHRE